MDEKKVHCTSLCPECGSDLAYTDDFCICKKCNWTCRGCKNKSE